MRLPHPVPYGSGLAMTKFAKYLTTRKKTTSQEHFSLAFVYNCIYNFFNFMEEAEKIAKRLGANGWTVEMRKLREEIEKDSFI